MEDTKIVNNKNLPANTLSKEALFVVSGLYIIAFFVFEFFFMFPFVIIMIITDGQSGIDFIGKTISFIVYGPGILGSIAILVLCITVLWKKRSIKKSLKLLLLFVPYIMCVSLIFYCLNR